MQTLQDTSIPAMPVPSGSRDAARSSAAVSSISLRILWIGFWVVAVALGLSELWIGRNFMNTDGISYLDVASAFSRLDWSAAVNAYWSPLYPAVLAVGLTILHPAVYNEFVAVHLINFGIFLLCAGSFQFFMTRLVAYRQATVTKSVEHRLSPLPEWSIVLFGQAIFLWTAIKLITIFDVSPDMLVATFVFLASGILLRIRTEDSQLRAPFRAQSRDCCLLGLALGFGYLAKAPMLPVGALFFLMAFVSIEDFSARIKNTVAAGLLFVLVAAPFVVTLSRLQHRLTWGDSWRLNYAWYVSGVPRYHWQGNMPGLGTPVHPSQKIHVAPAVYEFDKPGAATYSVWFDPTYWNQGVRIVFNWKFVARQVLINSRLYYEVFLRQQWLIVLACLILFVISGRAALAAVPNYWTLFLPAIAAMTMYAPVHVEERMIGSFVTLLWLGLFSALQFPKKSSALKWASAGIGAVAAIVTASLLFTSFKEAHSEYVSEASQVSNPELRPQWQVVKALNDAGIRSGDKVAWIRPTVFDGSTQNYAWARLSRIRIIAEIPSPEAKNFWKLSAQQQSDVFQSLSQTPAVAFVVTTVPPGADVSAFHPLGDTGFYVHFLHEPEQGPEQGIAR